MKNQSKRFNRFSRLAPALMSLLLVGTLACGFLGGGSSTSPGRIVMRTRLPTFTPTIDATSVSLDNVGNPDNIAPTGAAPSMSGEAVTAAPTVASSSLPTFTSEPGAAFVPAEALNPTSTSMVSPPSPLATDTPTPAAQLPPETAIPTGTPTTETAELPTPTSTSTVPAEPTPISKTAGWTFANIQIYPDQYEDGLLLYGEVINDTGVAQQLDYISGTFYDAQGQIIADEYSTGDFWPFELIPPGERFPFGLFVDGIYSTANFDLQVQAEPGSEAQRLDFEFLNLNQWVDEIGEYCLAGELRNPGGELQEYVLMMAILYDSQEKVVNFGDELEPWPNILGDDTLDFEICAETLGQAVARYELRAWGQ